jgi:hypothetical protein
MHNTTTMRYNSRHLITVIIKNGRRPFLTGTAITTVLLHRHCCPLVSTQTQHSHQQCASLTGQTKHH